MFLGLDVELSAPHVAGFFADVKYFPSGNVDDKVINNDYYNDFIYNRSP